MLYGKEELMSEYKISDIDENDTRREARRQVRVNNGEAGKGSDPRHLEYKAEYDAAYDKIDWSKKK